MFRLVRLNNFVIFLASFPVYVNLAHFLLLVPTSLIAFCVVVHMFLWGASYLLFCEMLSIIRFSLCLLSGVSRYVVSFLKVPYGAHLLLNRVASVSRYDCVCCCGFSEHTEYDIVVRNFRNGKV